MRHLSTLPIACALAVAVSETGCLTIRDSQAAIEPGPLLLRMSLEHTVGEFTFAIGAAEPKPSLLDGELLVKEIVHAWNERGYLRDQEFIDPGSPFSGNAEYQLTLNGHQHNDSSFWIEVLNALTLMLFPYTVTHDYDMQFVLVKTANGATYQASIQAHDETYVELLLLFALPVAHRGHDATMQSAADRLYEEFARQGAFQESPTGFQESSSELGASVRPEATGPPPDPAQP
jgi:hypothetical protein